MLPPLGIDPHYPNAGSEYENRPSHGAVEKAAQVPAVYLGES